jgi:hypothetical protein
VLYYSYWGWFYREEGTVWLQNYLPFPVPIVCSKNIVLHYSYWGWFYREQGSGMFAKPFTARCACDVFRKHCASLHLQAKVLPWRRKWCLQKLQVYMILTSRLLKAQRKCSVMWDSHIRQMSREGCLLLGCNDAWTGESPQTFRSNMSEVRTLSQAKKKKQTRRVMPWRWRQFVPLDTMSQKTDFYIWVVSL